MSNENLEATNDLREWDRAITLPILYSFDVVDVDNEVLLLPLVMDFRLRSVSTRHLDRVMIIALGYVRGRQVNQMIASHEVLL